MIMGLELEQVYDETEYIKSSIGLVRQNVVVGGILAVMVLLLFLRSWAKYLSNWPGYTHQRHRHISYDYTYGAFTQCG